MSLHAIETKGLVKNYGKHHAIKELDLVIEKGECFALLGPAAAGKTTLLQIFSGKTKPSRGSITIGDHRLSSEQQKNSKLLALIPQDYMPQDNCTVLEEFKKHTGLLITSEAKKIALVQELLTQWGLTSYKDTQIKNCPLAVKQNLSIALALVTNPQILLIDEPSLNCEHSEREAIWKSLEKLKGNITIVIATSLLEEALILADHIAILKKGKLIALGTPAELKRDIFSIKTLEVQADFIPENVLKAMVEHFPKVIETTRGVEIMGDELDRQEIEDFIHDHKLAITEISLIKPSLDDLFQRLSLKEIDF